MIALNDNSIFIGQIKQLLKDFNLPLCKIGDENVISNSYYIKQNMIYYYDGEISTPCFEYNYNTPYLNITDNFKIDNMIYDRATHNYLGKYLRFMRDYKNFNLMSMYNCFDGNTLDDDVTFNLTDNITIDFNSNSKNYIVYKIPISLVPIYSISIHNTKTIEICLYDLKDEQLEISKQTYKKIQINNMFHYEINNDIVVSNDLYLLLKIPKDLNTSIVILEGKYYNKYNKLNVLPIGEEIDFKIAAQLLSTENANGNYLLADRITEYLTGAIISNLSETYDIQRMQRVIDGLYESLELVKYTTIPKATGRIYGIWNEQDVEVIKYIALKFDLIRYDSLGYIDKDIENYLIANTEFDLIKFNIKSTEEDNYYYEL